MNSDVERPDVTRLIGQIKAGDEDAFGELVQTYHQRVYGVLVGMVRSPDDARDLSQQAWIKVWNKIHTFKGDSDFYTWLYRLVTFVGLDYIRKRNRQREVDLPDGMEPARDLDADVAPSLLSRPDRDVRNQEIREVFEAALATLSSEHRTALLLREVEGLSYDEIAAATKSRRGTVMSRIFYARKQIQAKLQELK